MTQLSWLNSDHSEFPDTSEALDDPNGLLAVGGDLSPIRLLEAYKRGIFPWYNEGQPILWWSPSPRMILKPRELHVGRSTRKLLAKAPFSLTIDQAFESVVEHCANAPRPGQDGTWINHDMIGAYTCLHELGHAHSVEAWQDGHLVGGLYGISIGAAFFGESMFSKVSGASKVAFVSMALGLRDRGCRLIDCQMHSEYLASFGAKEVSRCEFETLLTDAVSWPDSEYWKTDKSSGQSD